MFTLWRELSCGIGHIGVVDRYLTDAEALQGSIDEPALFARVYRRHVEAVARYLTRRVGNAAAEDLSSEVFVRAFRRRSAYEPAHATALPWLLGIASNLVGEHRRDERRRLVMLGRLGGAAPEMVEHRLGALAPELVRELRRLSSAERDTLLLVVWGELSYEEAAFALGIPLGTVRSRIARARERLARSIEADGGGPRPVRNGEAHA